MATAVPAQRPVTAAVGGAFIVACAVCTAVAAGAPDAGVTSGAFRVGWPYPPVMVPLMIALAAAGVMVMTQHRWARLAALLGAIVAAQMAGIGLLAVRAWFISQNGGMGYITPTPVTYAAAVTLAASAAAVAAAAMAWREPAAGWRSLVPAQPLCLVGAAAVLLLPRLWDAAGESGDISGLAHVATLTYSLPWGAGLAAAGWMRGRSGAAAGPAVTGAGVLCALFMLSTHVLAYYLPPPDSD